MDTATYLKQHIRTVADWPIPGVQFRDITPLLQDPLVFRVLIDAFVHRYMAPSHRPDVVAGLDARGFIIGSVLAYELGVGFVPIRKKGKLPFTTVQETYELEYGSAAVELHTDAVHPNQRVLLIDDQNGTLHCAHAPSGMADLQRRFAQQQRRAAPVRLHDAQQAQQA
ncbi:MAG: adenine phosphoribosyltransferase, partial [Burkholderiaceae bacterium]